MLSPSALSRPQPATETFPSSSRPIDAGEQPPPSSGDAASPTTYPASAPSVGLSHHQLPPQTPTNARKRKASGSPQLDTRPPITPRTGESSAALSIPSLLIAESGRKKGRTNTPWTAAEEQRLKVMRDEGKSWSEIAKAFPARTEGSVKKHWYKDMHYAEFAKDEEIALLEAIKEYDANKWKVIGQKLGKPAKACEQYAKEHFKNY